MGLRNVDIVIDLSDNSGDIGDKLAGMAAWFIEATRASVQGIRGRSSRGSAS